MFRRLLISLVLLLIASPALAVTDSPALPKPYCLYVTADPTLTNGEVHPLRCDLSGNLKTTAAGGPATVADGGDVTQGAKSDAKSTATDATPTTIMSVLKEISAMVQAPPAIAAGTNTIGGTYPVPQSGSANAIATVVSSTAETAHQIKGSAGNLYGFSVTTGATAGYVLVLNATSDAGNGAVTPKLCLQVPANSTVGWNSGPVPSSFTTGIEIVFSSTGCFTETQSATAFISARAQ